MPESINSRVIAAVDSWLRWLPSWTPGTHRARTRICRRCLGSPVVAAAGLDRDVPHQVQHALVIRMQRIVDRVVEEYTAVNLPLLHKELDTDAAWKRAERPYRPEEDLSPEYDGLEIDPEPEPGQPYLFTLTGLADQEASARPRPARPPLSEEQKQALRIELRLADECAAQTGEAVCVALAEHRPRIVAAVRAFVEPQIEALLEELSSRLELP